MKKSLRALSIFMTVAIIFSITTVLNIGAAALNFSAMEVAIGETRTLTLEGEKNIKWSSDNTKVATVTNGKVKGIAKGKANITAKSGSNTYKCVVTVQNIRIDTASDRVALNTSATLKVINNLNKTKPVWVSDNQSVATVTSKGVLNAKKLGNATIYAVVDDMVCKFKFTVSNSGSTPINSVIYTDDNVTVTYKGYEQTGTGGNFEKTIFHIEIYNKSSLETTYQYRDEKVNNKEAGFNAMSEKIKPNKKAVVDGSFFTDLVQEGMVNKDVKSAAFKISVAPPDYSDWYETKDIKIVF